MEPELYAQLRALAGRIHAERGGAHDVIQPTELLHEAWEKLNKAQSEWESRAHFVAVAARAMRQILIDRARARHADRRGGALVRTTLSGVGDEPTAMVDVLALDAALSGLEKLDPRCGQVVLLRTFGGLTVPEVADVLELSPRSVDDLWRFSRAWLATRLDPS
jgi:RNA polymerase sigma factor (TIGR02999 family)